MVRIAILIEIRDGLVDFETFTRFYKAQNSHLLFIYKFVSILLNIWFPRRQNSYVDLEIIKETENFNKFYLYFILF